MKSLTAFLIASMPLMAMAQQSPAKWPPAIEGERHVYKTVGSRELCLWQIGKSTANTDQKNSDRKAPAIVFFFGGGWTSGSPEQFLPQATYLATRGMATFVADYRVASRDKVKASSCVEDAKSAVRWLRANADKLGIDPKRICAAGGSAGGHIACATALLPGFEAAGEDSAISSAPNALALFNPAVILAPIEGLPIPKEAEAKVADLKTRLGAEPEAMSPAHHVRSGLPPAIIFHGEADETVRVATVQKFSELMKKSNNRCELKTYAGAPHGFFNVPNNDRAKGKKGDPSAKNGSGKKGEAQNQRQQWHQETLRELDLFLGSLGWISGEPTLSETRG